MTKTGRPTDYTEDIATKLFDKLSEGLSLRKACEAEGMPDKSTIFRWLSEANTKEWAQDFRDQYARAKREGADAKAEELEDIADEALEDVKKHAYEPKLGGALVQAYKLKADNLKWAMSKQQPKKYGEKLDLTSDGKRIRTEPVVVSAIKPRLAPEEPKK